MYHYLQLYEGDLKDEDNLRKWAMDQETLSIAGQIEEINGPLLDYFYELNDQFVVLFYEDDDRDADEIIEGLEGNGLDVARKTSYPG